jgi:hypothetical protein
MYSENFFFRLRRQFTPWLDGAIKICRLAFLLFNIFYVYRKNLIKSMSCVPEIRLIVGIEAGFSHASSVYMTRNMFLARQDERCLEMRVN